MIAVLRIEENISDVEISVNEAKGRGFPAESCDLTAQVLSRLTEERKVGLALGLQTLFEQPQRFVDKVKEIEVVTVI